METSNELPKIDPLGNVETVHAVRYKVPTVNLEWNSLDSNISLFHYGALFVFGQLDPDIQDPLRDWYETQDRPPVFKYTVDAPIFLNIPEPYTRQLFGVPDFAASSVISFIGHTAMLNKQERIFAQTRWKTFGFSSWSNTITGTVSSNQSRLTVFCPESNLFGVDIIGPPWRFVRIPPRKQMQIIADAVLDGNMLPYVYQTHPSNLKLPAVSSNDVSETE